MSRLHIPGSDALTVASQIVQRTRYHDATAGHAAARSHVDHPVGVAYHIQVMLDDDYRGPVVYQCLEDSKQAPDIQRMQSYRRLIEYEKRIVLPAPQLACQLQALRLASGKAGRGLPQREIAEPQVVQRLQPLCYHRPAP